MRRPFVFVLMLAAACGARAEVFRCTVDGKTVYQDAPCDGGRKVDVPNVGRATPGPGPAAARPAPAVRGIEVGMSQAEVRAAWGEPSRVFRLTSKDYVDIQWAYDNHPRPGQSDFIYFRDGVVSSISSTVQVGR